MGRPNPKCSVNIIDDSLHFLKFNLRGSLLEQFFIKFNPRGFIAVVGGYISEGIKEGGVKMNPFSVL